jgi:hypothetical protein
MKNFFPVLLTQNITAEFGLHNKPKMLLKVSNIKSMSLKLFLKMCFSLNFSQTIA